MKLEKYIDINYGVEIKYPEKWRTLYYAIPNLVAFSDEEGEAALFVYILSKQEEQEQRKQLLTFIGKHLFQDETVEADIENTEKKETEIIQGHFKSRKENEKFAFHATIKTYEHEINGRKFSEQVLTGITHREEKAADKTIEQLIENIEKIVEKKPSPMGFNVPLVPYTHKIEIAYKRERWRIMTPATWEITPFPDEFLAKAGGCIAGVQVFMEPTGQKPTKLGAEINIKVIADKLGVENVKTLEFKCSEETCYYMGETEDKTVRIYSIIEKIDRTHRSGEKRTFHIYRFAAYPTWLEQHFLPIATASLLTWTPLSYFLYEILGGTYAETTPPASTPTIKQTKATRVPRKIKTTHKPSETYKRFREKLREDMKKLADWEKNLWEITYTTLKMSDTITSMYTLEDKHKKTKLVPTFGLASPTTHRFWRHKEDAAWTTTVATRKPFVPAIKTDWMELKWKWEEEQRRLREETRLKKKKIDDMFS